MYIIRVFLCCSFLLIFYYEFYYSFYYKAAENRGKQRITEDNRGQRNIYKIQRKSPETLCFRAFKMAILHCPGTYHILWQIRHKPENYPYSLQLSRTQPSIPGSCVRVSQHSAFSVITLQAYNIRLHLLHASNNPHHSDRKRPHYLQNDRYFHQSQPSFHFHPE